MVIVSAGFVGIHVYTEPFDDRNHKCLDRLELLSLLSLTATLCSRLVYDARFLSFGTAEVSTVSSGHSIPATAVDNFMGLLWDLLVNAAVIGIPLALHAGTLVF